MHTPFATFSTLHITPAQKRPVTQHPSQDIAPITMITANSGRQPHLPHVASQQAVNATRNAAAMHAAT